jgi:hypothetical protein
MAEEQKTFSLLLCFTQTFLSKRNKIIKIKAVNHSAALGIFLDDYHEQVANKEIMTFCYEEMASQYGYLYSVK